MSLRFNLGRTALWNILTRQVVQANDPAFTLIQKFAPEDFNEMLASPPPVTMEQSRQERHFPVSRTERRRERRLARRLAKRLDTTVK